MADWLILRMPENAGAPATWLACDPEGRMQAPPQAGPLGAAAPAASGRRLIVLVPATAVLVTAADLPPKANAAKLAQVVPYALEEQLAEDVDALHFALGRRAAEGGRTPVAVVSKALLAEWLAELAAAGLVADALYGESELLPAAPGQTTALLEGDTLTIRRFENSPLVLPADSFTEAFELAEGPAAGDASLVASSLVLYASPEDWMRREADATPLRARYAPFKVQLLPNGPLPLLAQQLALGQGIDLLQGSYAPARSSGSGFAAWRTAAVLALCLVGLHAASEAVSLAHLKKTERELDGALGNAFRSAMPGEPFGSDFRRRMEVRLAAVHGNGASGGFLPALTALAQAHAAAPTVTIQSLSFSANAVDLKVSAPDAATLDRLSQRLRSGGWQADLTSAAQRSATGAPGAPRAAGAANAADYEGRIQMKSSGGAT